MANGKLFIGKPGATTITAYQAGGMHFAPAEPKSYTVEVGRKSITVRAKDAEYELGRVENPALEYSGLVNPLDTIPLPDPFGLGLFTVEDAMHQAVSLDGPLPLGTYTVRAKKDTNYQTDCYTITPVDGTFRVKQGRLWSVTIHVKDGDGVNLGTATVVVDAEAKHADGTGRAVWYLPAGSEHSVQVLLAGYSTVQSSFTVSPTDNLVEVVLAPATLKLEYLANWAEGSILGEPTQMVASDLWGEPVMVQPKSGYLFHQWSDGRVDNPRRDKISSPTQITALFRPLL